MAAAMSNNFFFCVGCGKVSYVMTCCGNSICNGSGCDQCDPAEREAAEQRIATGDHAVTRADAMAAIDRPDILGRDADSTRRMKAVANEYFDDIGR